jgi:hypothetical protein
MEGSGYTQCCPRKNDPSVAEEDIITFSSGYIQRSIATFPRQGTKIPWRLHQNYALDLLGLRYAPLEDGAMEFSGGRAPSEEPAALVVRSPAE